MQRIVKQKWLIPGLLIIVLLVSIVLPLCRIFQEALYVNGNIDVSHAWNTLCQQGNMRTIINSLQLGVVVVIASTLIASPIAYLLSKTSLAKHGWLDIVCMIPFMTPPYISSMGWILFMQKNGMLQQLFPQLSWISEYFFSFWGLALVMSFHVFPFMVTILKNAFLNINSSLEEAGEICGAGFFSRLWHIVIPLVKGNLAIGALLVFVKTISEYGTPATLGQRIGFDVFTTDIHRYSTTTPIDFGKSATLSSVLIMVCLGLWMLQTYITNRHTYALVNGKGKRVVQRKLSCSKAMMAWGYFLILLLIAIGIPYFSIIMTSFIKLRGYGLQAGNFTVQHYIDLFTQNAKGIAAMKTTFLLASSSATIATVFGTLVVLLIRKANPRVKKLIECIALLPEMLPGIVMVIALMLFWNGLYQVIPIYNTQFLLMLTFVILFLPYTVQYVTSSLTQVNDYLVQAGHTFGGSTWYVFRRILFPLIMPGAITGWIMTFIISFRELVAPSMMAPPNVLTISTFIVREFEQGSVSVGMAMAVICVLITTGVLLLIRILTKGRGTL